jgi:nitrogen regulatory protein P-II 1
MDRPADPGRVSIVPDRREEGQPHPGQHQLITCVVQRGKADAAVQAAIEAGAPAATISFARGTGIRQKLGLLKIAISPEKEVIDIVVASDVADKVFDAVVDAARLRTPGMGVIYMTPLTRVLASGGPP